MTTVRRPAVAGAFYPADPRTLATEVRGLIPADEPVASAVAAMVPHAGYVYSGPCAGKTLARLEIPSTVVLVGPNHTGRGVPLAYAPEDAWLTPLGKAEIDRELLEELATEVPGVQPSAAAHQSEHCLEVQVPLLQTLRRDVRIAPIVIGTHDLNALLALGVGLSEVVRRRDPRPLLLISSDMTHYESAAAALSKDERALEALEALDPRRLHQVVHDGRISMCGVGAAVAVIEAAGRLGARRGTPVCYTNSAAVTGDEREVVAYAGMVFEE
jgi:hypothetical protein